MNKWTATLILALSSLFHLSIDATEVTKKSFRLSHEYDFSDSFCTQSFCDQAGFFLFEGGEDYWRLNGTYATMFSLGHQLKFTAEYLAGKNEYDFSRGDHKEWINQVGFGFKYQMDLCFGFLSTFDIGFSYSHAFSEKVDTRVPNQSFTKRNIAGGDEFDVTLGTNIPTTLCNGLIYLFGSYQHLKYDRNFSSNKRIDGFGGGFFLQQPLGDALEFVLVGDFRKAYHFYESGLYWNTHVPSGVINSGLFFSHVEGRHSLKDENRVGISLSFDLCSNHCVRRVGRCPGDLYHWMKVPAVYRPRTLAISDESQVTDNL